MEKSKTTSEKIKVRACSIICINNPEWGTFGVYDDCGDWFRIHGRSGTTILFKSEANKFWAVVDKDKEVSHA